MVSVRREGLAQLFFFKNNFLFKATRRLFRVGSMETHFDAIILGTGLTESITAAYVWPTRLYVRYRPECLLSALSKAGFQVAHVDENPYYGAEEASLSLDELIKWADERSVSISQDTSTASTYLSSQRSRYTSISRSSTNLPHARQYSLSLSPSIIPAVGPLISSLVSSGVSRYGGFRLLEQVGVYTLSGKVMLVPGSKEDIFKNKDITLLDKRRLMRFLLFATSEFEESPELAGQEHTPLYQFLRHAFALNDELAGVIVYSLAFCTSASGNFLFPRSGVTPVISPDRNNSPGPPTPSPLSSLCGSLWCLMFHCGTLWRRR